MDILISAAVLKSLGFTNGTPHAWNWRRELERVRLGDMEIVTILQVLPPRCDDGQWDVEIHQHYAFGDISDDRGIGLPRTIATQAELQALLDVLLPDDRGPVLCMVVDCPDGVPVALDSGVAGDGRGQVVDYPDGVPVVVDCPEGRP